MDILCDDCVFSTPNYCSKSRATFPKATICADYRIIHWKKQKSLLTPPQKEFFTYSEGDKPQCIAYAYLP